MNPFGIQAYRSKRMPRSEKALYLVSILAVIVLATVLRS
jgi:cell division protein FtsL